VVIVNTSNRYQKGSVFLMPGLRLKSGTVYRMDDLYYPLKNTEARRRSTVQSTYSFPAAQLINQGLYVELHPFDAHIFVFEGPQTHAIRQYVQSILRELNFEWPLPRTARRLLSPALLRSSDAESSGAVASSHSVANETPAEPAIR